MNLLPNHGTKILGSVMTLLGVVVAASPDLLVSIFGKYGPGIAVAAGGVLTILRGFQNTSNGEPK